MTSASCRRFVFLLAGLSGCMIPPPGYVPRGSGYGLGGDAEAAYFAAPPDNVFAAVVSVLARSGYVLTSTNQSLGVVSGTQNAPVDLFAGSLVGATGMIKQMSVTVEPQGQGSYVRAVLNIALVKKFGALDPLSSDSVTTVSNRQRFFADLSATVGSPPPGPATSVPVSTGITEPATGPRDPSCLYSADGVLIKCNK